MREILFRGRRKNSELWVYSPELTSLGNSEHYLVGGYAIDPETVGQYTGLTDKNSKKIFEGDIVNCIQEECFGTIIWNNDEAGFYFAVQLEGGTTEEEHLYDYIDCIEVIGNIHDNPELLESEV